MTDATGELEPISTPEPSNPNVWSEYDIETHTSLIDRPLRTLKHGDAFAVLDSYGDIGTVQDTAEGLFYHDKWSAGRANAGAVLVRPAVS